MEVQIFSVLTYIKTHIKLVIHAKSVKTTFEVDHSLVRTFDNDGLVSGLVAFQPCRVAGFVTHKALVTLEYEDRPIDEIKVIFGVGLIF